MARRAFVIVVSAAIAVVSLPVLSGPAQALEAPVAYTSADLPTYQANGIAWSVASAQGKVFVGGSFTSIRPPGASAGTGEVPRTNFAVFDAATGQPTSCAPAVTLASTPGNATVRALTVSPDQKTLYVGGYFSAVDGTSRQHLAAIDIATCTVVKGFIPLPNATVRTIAATNSAVFYGGALTAVGSTTRSRAAAASAAGTADAGALLPWAPAFDKEVRSLDVKPDGSVVVVGGDFDAVNGAAAHALAVVDAGAGATVKIYPSGFFPDKSVVKDVVANSTGFYTASEGTGIGVFDGRAAFDWSGYSQRWRDTCLGATQALVVDKGVIYSASHAHDCSSMGEFPDGSRNHFLAQSIDDPTLLPWFPNTNEGLGEAIGPRDLTITASGGKDYLWSVGEFTSVNGQAQQSITRFSTGPDTVAPSSPTMSLSSPRSGQVRVAWRRSLDTDDATLTYRVYRDGALVSTKTAKSWFWDRSQLRFTDGGLAPGSTHSYRVSASDGTNTTQTSAKTITVAASPSGYAQRVISDGASFLWRYDETSDVLMSDATTSNSSGTLKGGAVFQVSPAAIAGDPSRALSLTGGTSAWIYSENRYSTPSSYTLETWFRTTTTRGGKLIGFGSKQAPYLSTNYDKHVYMTNAGQLIFGVNPAGKVTLTSAKSYNDGAWHHLAATQGSAGMALYIDGNRVGRNSTTGSQSYAGYWHVGGDNLANWPSAPSDYTFNGTLDETAVYPSALSASTVAEHQRLGAGSGGTTGPADFYGRTVSDDDPFLYWRLGETSGPTVVDATGGGNDGTARNGVTFGQSGAVSGTADTAARLSGSSTTASTGLVAESFATAAPSSFSVETWLKTTSTAGGKLIGFGSAASGDSATSDRHVYLRSDGRLTFGVKQSSGALTQITSSAAYNDGAYHQVVATKSSTGMTLYVDGAQVASSSASSSTSYTGYWRVGGDTLSGWSGAPANTYLAGTVDEVAVYLDALSVTQVSAHYSAGRASVADTAPPTMPQDVTVGLSAGDASLSWSASLDNRGVTSYQIYRAKSAGTQPSLATLVKTVTSTSTTDSAVPQGDWFYRVVARDAAGNSSSPSNAVSVVIPDTSRPSTPAGVTVTADAGAARLSWTSSTDNVDVTEYVVYRSTVSGFTAGPDNEYATVATTSFDDTKLTGGPFYYRVAARDAAGNISPASAQASAQLADTRPPTTPSEVRTSVSGSDVLVSWTASTDDTGVAGYDVYRSSTTGTPVSDATLVASTRSTSLLDATASQGTSYYQVVAKDAAGNRSTPSAEVRATVAAAPTVVTLSPTADTRVNEGAPSVNYGTSSSLSSRGSPGAASYLRFVLPDAPTGSRLTSAVLEIRTSTDPSAGSSDPHSVRLANDTWDENTVTWVTRPAATGAVLGAIPADTLPNTAYTATLDPAGLTPVLGSRRTISVYSNGGDGFYFWSSNYGGVSARPSLVLTFSAGTAPAPPPAAPTGVSTAVSGASVTVAWSASSGASRYDVYRASTAGATPTAASRVGSSTSTSFTETATPAGRWFYRVVAENAAGDRSGPSGAASAEVDLSPPTAPSGLTTSVSGSTVNLSWTASTDDVGVADYRVFRRAAADTTASLIATTTDQSYADTARPAGRWVYTVRARDAAGRVSDSSAEAEAVIAAAADTSPPVGPDALTATVTGSRVDLSWPAATDNVATTAYDVYRSGTQGFTPDAATLLSTVSTTSASDPSRPSGAWYYRVVARDAAGNRGTPSPEARAVVASASEPTTVSLNPTADTYGNQGAATRNFGTTSSLGSRGSLGMTSYLRFEIPAAPAGKTLLSAELQIRTTTESFAGSTETHTVRLAPDTWDELTLTWNNRPSDTGQKIGTLQANTAPDTAYTTSLDTATLAALPPGSTSFAMTNNGTDSLWFWSVDHAASQYNPQLTLTWG